MILYYVHDPMCSWCWAYRPTLLRLREALPVYIKWCNVLGGLAPDSDQPMPEGTRDMVEGHWRRIQGELGTPFNFDFWTHCQPRRSTYISCRAVLAAEDQGVEEDMILAIQEAYYLRAMNPSDEETLVQLATELNMKVEMFANSLSSDATEQELQEQIAQVRAWPVSGFPSFLLNTHGRVRPLPLDYRDHEVTLSAILDG
jgi:putative protein-disulfide isomerase